MTADRQAAVKTAEDYYDSADADAFYAAVWGGEDIHVGLYESPDEDIAAASARTVRRMADAVKTLGPQSRVLDLGAGYGGAARHLASRYGAHVTCLNLSEAENERNRRLTAEAGLSDRIDVVHGAFEDLPYPDAGFDIIWSQDAFLHSGDRARVLDEAVRVLKPGGEFIFTDPMQADAVDDPELLKPIYARIHLPNLASIRFYREALQARGLEEVSVQRLTDQLGTHYARVREELAARSDDLKDQISPQYAERMLNGLEHWVAGAKAGQLSWGVLHFRKP